MSRFKRLSLIAALLLVTTGLVLGLLFLRATRDALERAEAFQFRRMQVVRQGEDGPYRFFYITNRVAGTGDDEIENRYSSERGPDLSFGWFDTDIESTLGFGMLVDASDWFQNEEIRLLDVQALEESAFIEQLREQVRASPEQSLLININGFRERFPSALRKTAFLAHMLDIDTPMLVFDWPGNQGSSLRGYRRAQRVARESGAELARALALLLDEVSPRRLWLVANSMGGEVVVNAFSLLYQDPELADTPTEIEDVVLTAPDIAREEFGVRSKEEISALTRDLTVYVSSNDRALLMSRIVNRSRRLGESTLNPANPDQSAEAAKALELVEPGSERVVLVDVTPVNRTRNFHNFSLETPEFFDDLFLRLTNTKDPLSRLKYRVRTPDGRQYWVLTAGH